MFKNIFMGRKKGSLNKKTLERLAKEQAEQQQLLDMQATESNMNNETVTEQVVENDVSNLTATMQAMHEQNENETLTQQAFHEQKEVETQTQQELESNLNHENSLLNDFFASQQKAQEEQEQDEPVQEEEQSLTYQPLEKQLKALDFILVTLLRKVLNKKIVYMATDDIEFLTSLAGDEEINILPSGRVVFFVGLGFYYFSKIFEK